MFGHDEGADRHPGTGGPGTGEGGPATDTARDDATTVTSDTAGVYGGLWLDRYAASTGMYRLLHLLGFDREDQVRYGPYAFFAVLSTLLVVGGPAIVYLQDGRFPITESPGMLIIFPAWALVTWLARWLTRRHAATRAALPDPDPVGSPDARRYTGLLHRLGVSVGEQHVGTDEPVHVVPPRLKRALIFPALGLHAAWFVVDPSPMSHLIAIWGQPLALVFFLVVVPGVFFVLGAEVISLYIGVHVLLPLTVTAENRIDFSDPLQYGGLRPVGRLLRDSAASLLVLLALYLVFEAAAIGSTPFDAFARIILLGGIGFAIVTFLGPVYWLHRYMRNKKEAKIKAITEEVQLESTEGAVFPDIDPKNRDDFEFYTHEFIRINRVENMKEFPVDFSLVVEFVFVLVLPYLAHVSSIFVFEELLH